MLASYIAGVLVLWLVGVCYVLIVNRVRGVALASAAGDALGWVWVLVPWREWSPWASQGSHRLIR